VSNLNAGILDGLRRTGLKLRKLVIQSAAGPALVVSRDGSTTAPGAMWFVPGSGHAAGLFMLDQASGVTFALMPEVANAPGGVPALGGFGSAWVVAGATSGLAVSVFQVANSDGTQELRVQDNGVVETQNNTLDDGSGNASFTGVAALEGGTDTSAGATASTPTFVSGTALQLSTTRDVMLYIAVKTAASQTVALSIGSTSSATTTLITSGTMTAPIGTVITLRVPKSWYVKFTGTVTDWTFVQVTC
jgi:hypothetical protein